MTGKHSLSPVKEEGSLQEVLVFVHGFQTTFHSSLKGALRLARALSFRGSVVLYSWPSGDNWAAYQLATDNLEQEVMPLWALLQELEVCCFIKHTSRTAHDESLFEWMRQYNPGRKAACLGNHPANTGSQH